MTEQTEQSTAQPEAIPTQVALEDFIEAVSRGITRTWATLDDVGGYGGDTASQFSYGFGLVIYCRPPIPINPQFPLDNTVKKGE